MNKGHSHYYYYRQCQTNRIRVICVVTGIQANVHLAGTMKSTFVNYRVDVLWHFS